MKQFFKKRLSLTMVMVIFVFLIMLATMLIVSRPTEQLVIPASAVVRFENEDLVYVEIEPGRFRASRKRGRRSTTSTFRSRSSRSPRLICGATMRSAGAPATSSSG